MLHSWGRYRYAPQTSEPLAWRDAIRSRLADARTRVCTTLAFGKGRNCRARAALHSRDSGET